MKAYRIFAKFYDQYIQDTVPQLHQKYFDLVINLIEKFQLSSTDILDASCGTGILAKMFNDKSFSIEGADISNEMLQSAKAKGITTYHQDICQLNLRKNYDIILCFDTLGHILGEANLTKALLSISGCLKPGGVLICDGGTRGKVNNMDGQLFNYDSDDYNFNWSNTKQDDLVKVNFKIYEKKTARHYDETFFLQGHDIEDICKAAAHTDLKIIYATLEPIVKPKGSFIMCLRKK